MLRFSRSARRALDALLDGAFGDPIRVAGGLEPPEAPEEQAIELFERHGAEQASLLPDVKASVRTYIDLRALLDRAHVLAREERFLHWELAFPRVWRNWMSADPDGGFDAVIGKQPVRGGPCRPFEATTHPLLRYWIGRPVAASARLGRGVQGHNLNNEHANYDFGHHSACWSRPYTSAARDER